MFKIYGKILIILFFVLFIQTNSIKAEEIFTKEEFLNNNLYDSHIEPPSNNINFSPINLWIFKDGIKRVGFIVTGHSEKTVCHKASAEISNKLKALSPNKNSFSSFGIAYDFRPKTSASEKTKYNNLLNSMECVFKKLHEAYPEKVFVHTAQYSDYETRIKSIKNKITESATTPDITHVVEYSHNIDFPIIMPLYNLDTNKEISFQVQKSSFEPFPIKSRQQLLIIDSQRGIKDNQKSINKLSNVRKACDQLLLKESIKTELQKSKEYVEFNKKEASLNKKKILKNKKEEVVYHFRATKYVLNELKRQNKLIVHYVKMGEKERKAYYALVNSLLINRQVYLEKAQDDLDKKIQNNPLASEWIRKKITQEQILMEKSACNKYISFLNKENVDLNRYIRTLQAQKDDYSDKYLMIDGFLRGWPFDGDSEKTNNNLDLWYKKRDIVWNQAFSKMPASIKNSEIYNYESKKTAKFLGWDNIFFKVDAENNFLKITPYYVLSGDFYQIIDREAQLNYFLSPSNFRSMY